MSQKIAIRVSNKREFDALMKHYESKGWKADEENFQRYSVEYNCYDYHDNYGHSNTHTQIGLNYTIIDFPAFAQIAGIEVKEIIEVELGEVKVNVTSNGVAINADGYLVAINPSELDTIYTAYQSLK